MSLHHRGHYVAQRFAFMPRGGGDPSVLDANYPPN